MTDKKVIFLRSSKTNGSKSTEGESSTNEDDIWDDTLLIKAYDKAVQLAQESCLNKKQSSDIDVKCKGKKKDGQQKWKVGDKCRCQYSEDLKYYEADIVEILGSTGMCIVKYAGYENEEKVPLKKLKPSAGEAAIHKQCQEAIEESEHQSNMEVENAPISNTRKKSETHEKNSTSGKKGQFKKRNGLNENVPFPPLNFSLSQIGNSGIPPPPPPHIFSRLNEDENETEAMSAMLMSWYMSGYHTGYYQGLKMAKKL